MGGIDILKKIAKSVLYFIETAHTRVKWELNAWWLFLTTMILKKCAYGPFTGEFGHLLGHNLPFISYLHSKGVKIHFCGLEIHTPFFIDENGDPTVDKYISIRDFYAERAPSCNSADVPNDVKALTREFITKSKQALSPYWNNENHEYYFYFFRWWVLRNRFIKVYDLSKTYKTNEENSVVIFPRKWNANFPSQTLVQLKNNGEAWDYFEVSKCASKFFDKVYVIGHPVFCEVNFSSFDNVEVLLIADNSLILEKCCNSKLIISQHSGSVYLGEYTNTPVLIIYKGSRSIGNIEITQQFKQGLGTRHEFKYAFNFEEIENHLKQI
ncbi:hypothetical protein [Haliscomenobacter sp.]|uniref:hypothetical protein n=1 Tax=Haliscomenobacter sp. TaxID=2717303 RepID=UPI003BAC7965